MLIFPSTLPWTHKWYKFIFRGINKDIESIILISRSQKITIFKTSRNNFLSFKRNSHYYISRFHTHYLLSSHFTLLQKYPSACHA